MPDSLQTRPSGNAGMTTKQGLTLAGAVTAIGLVWTGVTFIQAQNDRTAAEAGARQNLTNQVTQLQASINSMSPRVEQVAALQGDLRSLAVGVARIEAQSSSIPGQIRDLDRTLVAQQAAVAGHQKDIDAIRTDVVATKADIIRRGEATAASLNQLRDYFFRMQRNGSLNEMQEPNRMREQTPQRIFRNLDADFQRAPQTLEATRAALRLLSGGQPQWRAAAWLIGRCAATTEGG